MAFVVDGAEWDFNGRPTAEVASTIEAFLARVWIARDRDEVIWIGEDFQTRAMFGDLDLWSLSAPGSPISLSAELWQELAAWLGTAPRYLDEEPWPAWILETHIQVGASPAEGNGDLAWAHHNVRTGNPVACLSLRRSGPHTTVSRLGNAIVHWVLDEDSSRNFWRANIAEHGSRTEIFERLAPHAFPNLYFPSTLWRGLDDFGGGFLAIRGELQRFLAVLDDYGNWAFTFPPPALVHGETVVSNIGMSPSNQLIERRFRGLDITMAPENPDVWNDNKSRRARQITIHSRLLYCEWHGKLEPHRNRVHVHPPVPESNGRVVVAIFHEHLPLPGD